MMDTTGKSSCILMAFPKLEERFCLPIKIRESSKERKVPDRRQFNLEKI
jgi:hypothetical protein